MSSLPSSLPSGLSVLGGVASGFLSGASAGSVVPGIGTAIGGAVGAVAGLIGSIFSGGPDTPTEQGQVIAQLQAYFPDQNSLICGQTFDLSPLNGGLPLFATLPCGDPNYANVSRSTLEWFIKTYGLASFLQFVKPFLSTTIGGAPGSASQAPPATPTSGLDTALGNLTSTLGGVVGAITGAIDTATQTAQQGQLTGIGAVTGTLGAVTQGLNGLQGAITGTITSSIGGLLDSLFNPSGSVVGAIISAIDGLGREQNSLLTQIIGALDGQLSDLEKSLLGIPVSLGAILKDIFQNLPKILVDLVNVFPGPLKDIVHAIEVLTGHIPKNSSSIDWSDLGNILATIAQAGVSIAGAVQSPDHVVLTPHDPLGVSCGGIDESNQRLASWLGHNVSLPCFVQDALAGMRLFFVELLRLLPFIEQFYEQAAELQNKSCPLTKLDPGSVIRAWQRQIITDDSSAEELAVQGFNSGRQKILKDLAAYLPSIGQSLDWWYRGVIVDSDFNTLLQQNGLTPGQTQAVKDGSTTLTPIDVGITAWLRGVITDDELSSIFTTNRFNTPQQDLYEVLSRRPPLPQEELEGTLKRGALGNFSLLSLTDFDTVPPGFSAACKRAGLDDDTAQRLWWIHWNLGGLNDWISAYYRGLRTLPELAAVAESFGVPATVLTDLIDIGRPLIPYRTIPGMIKGGIITEDRGRQLLAMHGFDSQSIDDLLKFATTGTKSSKATTAQAQHDVSLSTARTAYDDGILTSDQYVALLKAHGLDDNAAATELQVADLSNEVKARKQLSTDIVNEYNAGMLDQQSAIQQLATSGLSVAEQAAAVRKMKSASSSKAKQPSEAELRAWAKATIISPDEYYSRLVTIGWTPADAQHFRDLHFPSV